MTLMVFLTEFFEKVEIEKNQQTTKKHENFPRGQRVESHVITSTTVQSLHKHNINFVAPKLLFFVLYPLLHNNAF